MRKYFILGVVSMLVALTFTGCQNEIDENINPDLQQINVTIGAENVYAEVASKATYGGLGKINWDNTDKLGVFSGATTTTAVSGIIASTLPFSTTGGASASFTGAITEVIDAIEYQFYGVFPFAAIVMEDNTDVTKLKVTLPALQEPTLTSFDPLADILLAKKVTATASDVTVGTVSTQFSFNRPFAFTKLLFSGAATGAGTAAEEKILKITMTIGGADNYIAGTFFTNITTNKIVSESDEVIVMPNDQPFSTSSRTNEIVLDYAHLGADGQATLATAIVADAFEAWFVMNAVQLEDAEEVIITIETTNYILTRTLIGRKFNRGKINKATLGLARFAVTPKVVASVTATTNAATGVGDGTAILNGSFTKVDFPAEGQTQPTVIAGFEYNTTALYDTDVKLDAVGTITGLNISSATLTELANEEYTYKTWARIGEGEKVYSISTMKFTPAAPPSVTATTNEATGVNTQVATMNGTIEKLNFPVANPPTVTQGFEYKKPSDQDFTSVPVDLEADGTTITHGLTELEDDVEYTYRAWARIGEGEKVYSTNTVKFTPTAPPSVTATTNEATGINTQVATMNGTIGKLNFPAENSPTVTQGFEYNTTTLYDTNTKLTETVVPEADGKIKFDLTGLEDGVEYTYCAWAQIEGEEKVYGDPKKFTPDVPVPVYTKVTGNTLTSGSYIMVAVVGGVNQALAEYGLNDFNPQAVTITDSKIVSDPTTDALAVAIVVAEGGATCTIARTILNQVRYLTHTSSNRLLYSTTEYNWEISSVAEGGFNLKAPSTSRYLGYHKTNSDFMVSIQGASFISTLQLYKRN